MKSKIVLVVGGSSGIGESLVKTLVENEISIINVDIKHGIHSDFVRNIECNISNDSDIQKLINQIEDVEFNHVHFCAGIGEDPTPNLKKDIKTIDNLISINSSSLIKILSRIKVASGGSITVVSSAHSIRAASQNPIYSATKGFIDSFVRSYSRTLINQNPENPVRINAVSPEMVSTPLIDKIFDGREEDLKSVSDSRIMKRMLAPKEVSDVMEFLSSSKASGITGELISIGGKI